MKNMYFWLVYHVYYTIYSICFSTVEVHSWWYTAYLYIYIYDTLTMEKYLTSKNIHDLHKSH